MKSTLVKILIALAFLACVGIIIYSQWQESKYAAQFTGTQGLSDLQNQGYVEVKSFESWCQQNVSQTDFAQCVEKRTKRAQLLLAMQACQTADKTATEVTRCTYTKVCTLEGHTTEEDLKACVDGKLK